MKRRAAVTGLAAAMLAMHSVGVRAQPASRKPRLVGFLGLYSAKPYAPYVNALREGLRALGQREGIDLVIEYRWADGVEERLPELARQLVALQPDLIVTHTGAGIRAAQAATSSIPIVMGVSADPVGQGHVASLARPGGNTTGVSSQVVDLSSKRLELLKQAVPRARRVAVLSEGANPAARQGERELRSAASKLGIAASWFGVAASTSTLDPVFATLVGERVDGIVVEPYPLVSRHIERIVAFAATHRLPTIGGLRQFAEAGGLLSYGGDFVEGWRLAATYVHKILNGANPAELPVEQPTKFELTINLKTAQSLGLAIPQSLLVRADGVIR